ncbi:MAG TPA: PQQ-dependent sugar dehydrogenase, partial [Opitutus sp.]|nr:PQQ-dependent sugar dehydrogenase [Opitutus sp.]
MHAPGFSSLVWLLGACAGLGLLTPTRAISADGAQLASQFCASCHGEALTGARAPALRGGRWQRARNDAEAMQIVVRGLPDAGMPAFGDALSEADRAALLAFMRSSAPPQAPARSKGEAVRTQRQNFAIETVASGFEVPWSIAFLPDGRLLVTERAGRLRIVDGGKVSPPIQGIPRVWYRQDGGLLSVALHPDYAKTGWVYLSYSEPGREPRTSMTKIVRGRVANLSWVDQETVWEADRRFYSHGNDHYGCRLLFHRGKLFFSIGERSRRAAAQNLGDPRGKIHRIEADGDVPADNPFVRTPGALPTIWSYGHRNPQGLAVDSRTGDLWATEHGPMGGDELNRIEPGQNYGWPVVTHGREHSGAAISEFTSKPGMMDPVRQWTPSI